MHCQRNPAGTAPLFGYDAAMHPDPSSPSAAGLPATAPFPEPAPATRVLRQFRVVFNAVKTHFRNVEKSAGIGGSQLWALSVIQQRPGIGVGELARALDIHQTTASNLVRTMAAQGLLAQGRNGADRRAVTLTLLPAGMASLERAPLPFAGVLPDALAAMDAATLARMEQDLATLIQALRADGAGAHTPLADL
jgi:DNA-binding MarR family transcriptional regulator